MGEKNMVTIPYEDFANMMRMAGRVEAALAVLKADIGDYVKRPTMITILEGEETVKYTNILDHVNEQHV